MLPGICSQEGVDEVNGNDLRKLAWKEKMADLSDGRKVRAATFRAKKGKGSYRRKSKHGGWK